jgi:hypothetical protein
MTVSLRAARPAPERRADSGASGYECLPAAQAARQAGDKWMRPGRLDPAHLILALFRVHAAKIRLRNPANFEDFSRQLKVIIATPGALMHRAIGERGQHPTFLIQPLIAKSGHTRP